jgi:hypothetical protein
MSFALRVVLAILGRYRAIEREGSHTICDIALGRSRDHTLGQPTGRQRRGSNCAADYASLEFVRQLMA